MKPNYLVISFKVSTAGDQICVKTSIQNQLTGCILIRKCSSAVFISKRSRGFGSSSAFHVVNILHFSSVFLEASGSL